MALLIRIAMVGLFIFLTKVAVIDPLEENRTLRMVRENLPGASPWRTRALLEAAESIEPSSPYLRGKVLVQKARALRALGREEQAVEAYEESLMYRNPPHVRAELGLYLIEMGRVEPGVARLAEAAAFSPALTEQVPREIRVRVEVLLRRTYSGEPDRPGILGW